MIKKILILIILMGSLNSCTSLKQLKKNVEHRDVHEQELNTQTATIETSTSIDTTVRVKADSIQLITCIEDTSQVTTDSVETDKLKVVLSYDPKNKRIKTKAVAKQQDLHIKAQQKTKAQLINHQENKRTDQTVIKTKEASKQIRYWPLIVAIAWAITVIFLCIAITDHHPALSWIFPGKKRSSG